MFHPSNILRLKQGTVKTNSCTISDTIDTFFPQQLCEICKSGVVMPISQGGLKEV